MKNKVLGFAFAPNNEEFYGTEKGFCSPRIIRKISQAPSNICSFNVVFITLAAGINSKKDKFTDKLANHFQIDIVFTHEALHAFGTQHILKEI